MMNFRYDVIVIGAGHAGCEAASAAARLGAKTCLITMDMNKIAQMSCNPAIGGIAKGQIVRETDALGGYIGKVTDATAIQFKMLNRSKGPAMWSPRAQCDRARYITEWREILENTDNLHIWQDTAERLIIKYGEVRGLETVWGVKFMAKTVIITAGTFLNGLMHIGRKMVAGGRCAEPASYNLSESIAEHGVRVDRMKTGTPVRIDSRSVHFEDMEPQTGEDDFHKFSFMGEARKLPQLNCWTTYTNKEVHDILASGLDDSPLYNGQIKSIGPRYCPSIETKLHTFPDKDKHQLFLEPEGMNTHEMYLNGFSSSLPIDVQLEALRKIPAFRDITIYRPGYAIEYDFFDPTQLLHTLESKLIKNLYLAGQVNGTTGYEEAAGQGIIAGINAAMRAGDSKKEFTLGRDEAYIGVLIDDLVTKGVDEPYRMFTSRAEYRILLRQDDADMRLTPRAYELGLATGERYERMMSKKLEVDRIIEFTENYSVKPAVINGVLETLGTTPIKMSCKLDELIARPQINFDNIAPHIPEFKEVLERVTTMKEEIHEAAEVKMKYKGYIRRERMIADKIHRLESIQIRGRFDYDNIQSLTIEARQKLKKIDPATLAQASRIPGISPSDINVLLVLMGR